MKEWMKDAILVGLMAVVFCSLMAADAAEKLKIGDGSKAVTVAAEADTPAEAAARAKARRLSVRQRRGLGLNCRNVRRIALDLKAKGELDDTPSRAAAQIARILEEERPAAFDSALDEVEPQYQGDRLDAIIEFIERLLELLMKFLPLFVV